MDYITLLQPTFKDGNLKGIPVVVLGLTRTFGWMKRSVPPVGFHASVMLKLAL